MLYGFDDYHLDVTRQELRRAELSPSDRRFLDLLHYLIRNRERVVSKDDLITHVWKVALSGPALTSRIATARQAVGTHGRSQRLITLARKGIASSVRFGKPDRMRPPQQSKRRRQLSRIGRLLQFSVHQYERRSGRNISPTASWKTSSRSCRFGGLFVIARNSSFGQAGRCPRSRA